MQSARYIQQELESLLLLAHELGYDCLIPSIGTAAVAARRIAEGAVSEDPKVPTARRRAGRPSDRAPAEPISFPSRSAGTNGRARKRS